MSLPPLSMSTGLIGSIVDGRHQMFDLQRQLSTGKIANTYGGLEGTSRLTVLNLRSELSALNGYESTIKNVNLRLDISQQTLTRFNDINSLVRTDSLQSSFNLTNGQQTVLQQGARVMFDEMSNLLNSRVGDRHIFAGRQTQSPPVPAPELLINGDGTRAGLKQMISERQQADVGAGGIGRLAISNPAATTVRLAEDGVHPFGLKIGAVVNNLNGVNLTGPAGAPTQADLEFTAVLPDAGDTVSFTFTLPDGTSETLQFTAVAGTPGAANEFEIGADETATSANFQAALQSELTRLTETSVKAASAFQTAEEFFAGTTTNPPQRVDGPPFDSATAQIAGTAANSIIFYEGDDDNTITARQSALAEIDENVVVGYGVRADEEAVKKTLAAMGVLSAVTFSSADANASSRYAELTSRVASSLADNPGQQTFANIMGELGNVQRSVEAAHERHQFSRAFTEEVISDREDVTLEEVGAQILTLQTRMQASMETTSLLARLSLINFI